MKKEKERKRRERERENCMLLYTLDDLKGRKADPWNQKMETEKSRNGCGWGKDEDQWEVRERRKYNEVEIMKKEHWQARGWLSVKHTMMRERE